MSEENFSEEESEGIKSLRKAYDAQKKQLDEAMKELGTFRAERRQSSVADVLKAKGLPASAAKLYHGEDTSAEAVGKWIEEFADVFGTGSQANENDQNAANAARVSGASGGTGSPVAPSGDAKSPVLGDPAELMHAMQTLPYEELQRLGIMPPSGTLFSR